MLTKPSASSSSPSQAELMWRNTFFYLSALLAALALVDFDRERFTHGLSDLGVACLMISLIPQFPLVRAIAQARGNPDRSSELMRNAEELRQRFPWADQIGAAGWVLFAGSFVLRAFGVH